MKRRRDNVTKASSSETRKEAKAKQSKGESRIGEENRFGLDQLSSPGRKRREAQKKCRCGEGGRVGVTNRLA